MVSVGFAPDELVHHHHIKGSKEEQSQIVLRAHHGVMDVILVTVQVKPSNLIMSARQLRF